jgi:hypothetical protein
MKVEALYPLLQKDENGALDFKRKPHSVFNDNKVLAERNQHELIRDVVALANGNPHVVGETAYLIFGAGDKRDADGNLTLYDVGDFQLSRRQLLDWINTKIAPRITELDCSTVKLEDKRLFVITIYPSEDVHITTSKLQTADGKQYSGQTTFIRINESNKPASREEERTLGQAKRRYFEHSSYINPVWAVGLSAGITAFLIYWAIGDQLITDEMINNLGHNWTTVLILTVPPGLFLIAGLLVGKVIVDFKDIQRIWIQGTKKRRILIVLLGSAFLAYVGSFYWLSGLIGLR